MQISGIGGIGRLGLDTGLQQAVGAPVNPGQDVGHSFRQILDGLDGASREADTAVADLATGGERDLHDVVLAVEMESLAFDLAIQIRNRLLEAYSEVFRMQV
jgi:flagellar hook-basal body complex protein FliE